MIDRLLSAHPEAELWWDSLPSAFDGWARMLTAQAPETRAPEIRAWIQRLAFPDGLLTGATTNPRLVLDGLRRHPEWLDGQTPYPQLSQALFQDDARRLAPMWERSQGRQGWVCAQLSPEATFDVEALVAEGLALAALAPNLMIKVPGSQEGFAAIARLTARGIATNATLVFSVAQVEAAVDALRQGLSEARRNGVDLSRWRAVVTFMIGRIGQEPVLREQAAERGLPLDPATLRTAELAIFERAYQAVEALGEPVKLLMCSLKLDREGDHTTCRHLEGAMGHRCVVTMPPPLLSELLTAAPVPATTTPPEATLQAVLELPYLAEAHASRGMPASAFGSQPAFQRGLQEVRQAYHDTLAWLPGGAS